METKIEVIDITEDEMEVITLSSDEEEVSSPVINVKEEKRINVHDLDPDAPDWPNYRNTAAYTKHKNARNPDPVPLLIKECARLMPTINARTGFIDWYPFNMPDIVIRRITIVAMFLQQKSNRTHLEFIAHDGTAIITVLYGRDRYEKQLRERMKIDDEHNVLDTESDNYAKRIRSVIANERKTGFISPADQQFYQKHKKWWLQTAAGMKGKSLVPGDYLKMFGYCDVAGKDPLRHQFIQRHGQLSPIVFKAYKVDAISEIHYNHTLENRISNEIRERYEFKG